MEANRSRGMAQRLIEGFVDKGSVPKSTAREVAGYSPEDRIQVAEDIARIEADSGQPQTDGRTTRTAIIVNFLSRPKIDLEVFTRTVSSRPTRGRSPSKHSASFARDGVNRERFR